MPTTQYHYDYSKPMMLELDPDAVWSHEGTASLCSDHHFKSQEGPTLSNDIWSKFDLLLTPPRTPLRDTDFADLGSLPDDLNLGSIGSMDLPLLEGDDLEGHLDSLDLDVQLPSDLTGVMPINFSTSASCSHGQLQDNCSSCEKLALAGSELRHDCMWVGTCTAEAHANQKNRIHHDSTCSHISDLLMDSSQACFDVVAGFTQLDDFRHHEEDDDDSDAGATHLDDEDDDPLSYHMPRPDTPSESSETDTEDEHRDDDEDDDDDLVGHEEEGYSSGSPASTGLVHSDHTYSVVTSYPTVKHIRSPSSLLHTPSDSEDEIDVVSVGGNSSDSAYSCSTRPMKRSSSSSNSGSNKRTKPNVILSCSSDGSKKIYRIHTNSLPSSPSSKVKKHLQEAVAESVKLKPRRVNSNSKALKSPKRHHQRGSGSSSSSSSSSSRKRNSPRPESDDPDKREMHNSLERMRRVDLRNAFEDLRTLIPDLSEKEKAPKVEILKKASHHCTHIFKLEQSLVAQLEKERKYHSNLLKRLQALQRQAR